MAAPALGYEDGLRHAHDFLQGLSEENPFAGKTEFGNLADASRAANPANVPAPRQRPPAAAVPAAPAPAPLYPRPTSKPNSAPPVSANTDPFTNGFFKTPAQRAKIESDRLGGGAAALPRASAQPPSVGGTRAVPAPIDPIANAKAGMLRVSPYQVPGTPMTTSIDSSPGTRRPFIAGADGKNVAGDFVAGGRFSSAKAGSDPTLDQNYVGGLPRTTPSSSPSTPVGSTRAVTIQPRTSLSSVPTSGPNTESPSAHTVPDVEEPGANTVGLPRTRNQRAVTATRPRIFGG